ncbi:hypothetical protein [Mycobacteroides abscessus]|uniref:hypothetical protein n=1 Tax=Mycobacteroides abscessus TaxID=36809 RepID=UPI000C25D568|nr:hypothetical protein [Mycobacteroides abscessus]
MTIREQIKETANDAGWTNVTEIVGLDHYEKGLKKLYVYYQQDSKITSVSSIGASQNDYKKVDMDAGLDLGVFALRELTKEN